MKIKQQSAIKRFLVQEFGGQKGLLYFRKQESLLQNMIQTTEGRSRSQFRTLTNTILPGIALYRTLMELEPDKNTAFETMHKYLTNVVGAGKHRSTVRMEKVPGFFYLYKTVFLNIMRTTDLQESVQAHGRDYYDITITRCLWHDACVEHGCPELCPLFCDVDDVTYGGLHKIAFSRTKTLGYGGDCCDFHFFRK